MKTPPEATEGNIELINRLTAAAEQFDDDNAAQPTYNAHVCKKCGHAAFSVHVHTGTCSARITCTEAGCGGEAWSSFYRMTPETLPECADPAWEWYRPTLKEMQEAPESKEYLNHVLNNGLLLRARGEEPMLCHGGHFIASTGAVVESESETNGLKELGALQHENAKRMEEKRIITHGVTQEFNRLKKKTNDKKRKARQQKRKSQRRNKRK